MIAPRTDTRIPIALIGLGVIFRIGAFLLWPLMLVGILALCGLLAWGAIESGRYLILLYILPIPLIGGYICYQGAVLTLRRRGSAELAVVASRSKYPELWAFAEQCASAVGAMPPDNILVGMSANFYVTQSPILLMGRSSVVKGRTLYVSAPLLKLMSEMEIKAVLAHEFAHFTGSDTVYSTQIAPVYASLNNGITALKSEIDWNIQGIVLAVPMLITLIYHKLFHILNSAISRKRELRCDEIASFVYGKEHMAIGLMKVVGYGTFLSQYMYSHFFTVLNEQQTFYNYPEWFARYAADESVSSAVNDIVGNALVAKTQASDSHPALRDRLKALDVSSMTANYSYDDAFGLKQIEIELTEFYSRQIDQIRVRSLYS